MLNAALRTPLVLARELALLDLLSDGRLEVGLGAGWDEREHCSAGVPFASAGERGAGRRTSHGLGVALGRR